MKNEEIEAARDTLVKHMVDRFLGWKLPADFRPDAGISFTKHPLCEPIGTNLLDATQAEAMVRHMLEEMPTPTVVHIETRPPWELHCVVSGDWVGDTLGCSCPNCQVWQPNPADPTAKKCGCEDCRR